MIKDHRSRSWSYGEINRQEQNIKDHQWWSRSWSRSIEIFLWDQDHDLLQSFTALSTCLSLSVAWLLPPSVRCWPSSDASFVLGVWMKATALYSSQRSLFKVYTTNLVFMSLDFFLSLQLICGLCEEYILRAYAIINRTIWSCARWKE